MDATHYIEIKNEPSDSQFDEELNLKQEYDEEAYPNNVNYTNYFEDIKQEFPDSLDVKIETEEHILPDIEISPTFHMHPEDDDGDTAPTSMLRIRQKKMKDDSDEEYIPGESKKKIKQPNAKTVSNPKPKLKMMEWNDEQVLVLIDLYRERRLLWDSSDSQHKLKNQRHDSLTEIALSLGVDKNEIERKWKNLTSHFWREKKKEAETKRTGSGADEPYVSKWFAYQSMNFLGDKNKPRNTQDSTQRKEEEDEPQDSQEEGINDDSQVVQPQNSEDKQASTVSPSEVAGTKKTFKSPKALKSKSARRRLVDSPGSSNALDEALNVMRSLQSKRANIDDEYSLYGEQIAIKLSKLSSPRTRLVVQNKINQLLFEAEVGYLEHQHGYNVPQVNIRQNSGPANPMVPSFPQTSNMPNQTQPPFFTDNMTNSTSQWFSTSGYSSLPSSISSYLQSASPASTNSELSNC